MTTSETVSPNRALRTLFTLNGAGNAIGGPVLLLFTGVIDVALGLPAPLFATICGFYLVYGAAMWFVGRRSHPRAAVVVGLTAVNPVWALACLLVIDQAGPTTLGTVLLAAEATLVTVLAVLEARAYRRSRPVLGERATRVMVG